MERGTHNKIINQVAKDILKPMGLTRRGQSRTWLDDNIWFTTIFEYQPSSWSRGTYLNIGINFNWYLKEHLSFDYGYRESNFVDFKSDEQFQLKVTELTSNGLEKVLEYRNFRNINHAKSKILSHIFPSNDLLGNYHRAMICLMTGDYENSLMYCNKLMSISGDFEWIKKLKDNVSYLMLISKNKALVINYLIELIMQTRQLKKLPFVETEILRQQLDSFIN